MKNYKLSIPKPCHENWNAMTPNEKGKFCKSCAKTVVDFTKKTPKEIQEYLSERKNEKVCGHFYRKQLDSIVIQIPEHTFHTNLSFQKSFILILLIVMGTTLFSCKTETNKIQKIEKVELIDSLQKIDSLPVINKQDSLKVKPPTFCLTPPEEPDIMGEIPVEGEIEMVTLGLVIPEELNKPISISFVDTPPRFFGTKKVSKEELKKVFEEKMKDFVINNFDASIAQNLGLSIGKKRIAFQFTIDSLGNVIDIKVRAPHPTLKNHTLKMVQKLPKFHAGEHQGEKVSVTYTLPITFMVE
ncbi:energy transducer TonB [Tenacibaculum sp. M341]|uniref:energy transducer TonB n=1 Tax=Tenacibaculum sp. M341 TaxID=2530339 RepID=UPI0010437ADB|nr:energy transducer TonB [Tenacibaculum sp. M341]TCI92150.1 hypothetical protein EYW44_08175 [Tenacibaculum sp. M341]